MAQIVETREKDRPVKVSETEERQEWLDDGEDKSGMGKEEGKEVKEIKFSHFLPGVHGEALRRFRCR